MKSSLYLKKYRGKLLIGVPCLFGDLKFFEARLVEGNQRCVYQLLSVPTETAFAYMDVIWAPWTDSSLSSEEQEKLCYKARREVGTDALAKRDGLNTYLRKRTYTPFVALIADRNAYFRGKKISDEEARTCVRGIYSTWMYVSVKHPERASVLPRTKENKMHRKLYDTFKSNPLLVHVRSLIS